MAEENEVESQIDAESALMHVMYDLHQYMCGSVLHNVSRVCRSWRYSALHEQMRRPRIQQLQFVHDVKNLANQVDVIPVASVLFYDNKLRQKLSMLHEGEAIVSNDYEEDVLKKFVKQLPGKTVVLVVDRILTTAEMNVQDTPNHCEIRPRNHDILGVFFSNMVDRIKINVASFAVADFADHLHDLSMATVRNGLIERLGFNSRRYKKSGIIMFSSWNAFYYSSVLVQQIIDSVQHGGETVTCGCIVSSKHVASDNKVDLAECNEQIVTMLRISGPSVETWSVFVDYRVSSATLDAKLQELREKVTHKRHYTGFLYSINCIEPGCEHLEHPSCNSHEMMRTLKRLFPSVPFVGNFMDIYPPKVPVDKDHAHKSKFLWNMQLNVSIVIVGVDDPVTS